MTVITRPIWLNFDAIDTRCAEIADTTIEEQTDADRAALLGTTASSLSRWRRGLMDITLGHAVELADRIGMSLADIVTASKPPKNPKPPSAPKPQPKPPAGPGKPVPPAGPSKEAKQ